MSTDHVPAPDVLDTLVQRSDFLTCVLDGPRGTADLGDDLDVSRSTVERAMNALETAGLVESCDQGYRTTSVGGVVTTDFLAVMGSVEEANQNEEHGVGTASAGEMVEAVSSRRSLLDSLQQDPKSKRALVDELGASRSTVDRSVRDLEARGLVEYNSGTLAVTPVGRMAMEGLSDLTDTIELGQRLEKFLEWMPPDAFEVDFRLLADADIVVAEPGDPWAMINKHVTAIKEMDRCQGLLPFTGLHAQEAAYEQVIHHDASAELVVEPDIAEVHMSNPDYAELTEEMIATGRLDYFEYEGEFPYALALIDETVQIIASEGEEPRAVLESENDEIRVWAEEKYDEYRQQSQKLT